MASVALTTIDNPISPFDDFAQWFIFDAITHKYCSSELLARRCYTSEQFTQEENDAEVERAIDDIIANDPLGIYAKISINSTPDDIRKMNDAARELGLLVD